MQISEKVYMHGSSSIFYTFTHEEITTCPICNYSIKPIVMSSLYYLITKNQINIVQLLLCPHCKNSFIAQYSDIDKPVASSVIFNIKEPIIAPRSYQKQCFSDIINSTSPNFIEIYNQSLAAESQNLDEIAGIGYRKSLEFLIKDFLILKEPNEKESIIKLPLMQCINSYLSDNPMLQTAASRAVWLGNDQTHYIQKFEDKEIKDLKLLISLTVHWISMILETEEAATIEPRK